MNYFTHLWHMPQVPTFRFWSPKFSWECPWWLPLVLLIAVAVILLVAEIGIYVLFGGPMTPAEAVSIIYAIKH